MSKHLYSDAAWGLYPLKLRTELVLDIMTPRFQHLLFGNYANALRKNKREQFLRPVLSNIRYWMREITDDGRIYGVRYEEVLVHVRELVDIATTMLQDINRANYVRYQNRGGARAFIAYMQSATHIDVLAHRFMTGFVAFSCYASEAERTLAIEHAVRSARRLAGGPCDKPEYMKHVAELRLVVAYVESRRAVDPWDAPRLMAPEDLEAGAMAPDDMMERVFLKPAEINEIEDKAGFARRFLAFFRIDWPFLPHLRNVLLETEPYIRSSLAVAFASITHERLGRGQILFGLETPLVRLIMELAGYYLPCPPAV